MKNKKKTMVIVAAVMILFVIAALMGKLLLTEKKTISGGLELEKNTVEWSQNMKSADESADIQIPYYSDIYMEEGTDFIDMMLVNPKENECYFSYTFILSETEETIYQSNLIEPGKALEEVNLQRKMEKGTYPLKIVIDTYSMENQDALNNAIVSTDLIVS